MAGEPDSEQRPLGKRLLWFAGLWLASVIALGIVAYGIRAVLL
ncbi:DUF2474 domain-containing protein [Gimibacter soli]|uniref:DUF2474 domain-containing protein n=1 Tax=Gimibacter soli TaxID=3024400 RepID=A0AAE9XNM7_9PROT|nr:DUF2474 domain-containing protein [Gimibacter soli]WCL54342.1 DUF2474 domain-containing protein [Gimibacter soli]